MSHIALSCSLCGAERGADMRALACGECGAPLDVKYLDAARHTVDVAGLRMPVPHHAAAPPATLGEGGTPIVALPRSGAEMGLRRLFAKLEYMNPTGSFKDRGAAAMLSVAVELGVGAVVEDSSGNAGAAVAAYAARAGIQAHVFAPESAPKPKMDQIRVYEAQTHPTPGAREASAAAAAEFQRRRGMVYASHNLSPYFVEGTKAFGYEVAAEMRPAPDHIVMPVGNGSLLLGAWTAYRELMASGVVSRMPRLHAIQAEAVMPIVAEFGGARWRRGGATIAGGIAVAEPPRKAQVVRALRDTGGAAVAVSDGAIRRWRRTLAAREGVFAEPTSAAAFAGAEALAKRGVIQPDDVVLAPVTGFGLKD